LTPLMSAIRYDQAEALQCLVENDAAFTTCNRLGQNVLHLAALYAGSACMTVLTTLPLEQMDSNALDATGRTATEYFEERKFRYEDLEVAFGKLMQAAGNPGLRTPPEEYEDTDEEGQDGSDARFMPGSFTTE